MTGHAKGIIYPAHRTKIKNPTLLYFQREACKAGL